MDIDVERPETWTNLKRMTPHERKEWITGKMSYIIRTLDRYILTTNDFMQQQPWDTIGYACLNDTLYKEAEHVYDSMMKKAKGRDKLLTSLTYCRGIAKFHQGRYKEAYEDFRAARHLEHLLKEFNTDALRAISYMENTIFPMIDMVAKSKEKFRHELNVPRYVERSIGPNILKTLHKWNSSSPLYSTNISQGGGYLLTLKNKQGIIRTIAIDPGYNFLEIFKDLDLSIVDLDAIIATHDHDDHTESIEAILSLLAKHNDNVPRDKIKVLDIFGSPGVMLKYQGLFDALDPCGNKEINFKLMSPNTTIDHVGTTSLREKYGCVLHVKQAFHEELWTHEESTVGVVIETNVPDKNNLPIKIGITADTRYEEGLGEQYKGCQILLLNIGSLEKEEGKLLKQHLGLIGSINVIKESRPVLAIVTEFGEEFRGKRATVCSVMEEWANPFGNGAQHTKVFPTDMHFEVRLTDFNIKETSSNVFLPYNMVETDEEDPEMIIYRLKEHH